MSNTARRKQANPLTLRLKPKLVQAVNRAAEAAGQSRNAFLRESIEHRLRREQGYPLTLRLNPELNAHDLREWRQDHDLTQAELARILRVTRTTLVRWERGRSAIPGPVGWALESVERHLVRQRLSRGGAQ